MPDPETKWYITHKISLGGGGRNFSRELSAKSFYSRNMYTTLKKKDLKRIVLKSLDLSGTNSQLHPLLFLAHNFYLLALRKSPNVSVLQHVLSLVLHQLRFKTLYKGLLSLKRSMQHMCHFIYTKIVIYNITFFGNIGRVKMQQQTQTYTWNADIRIIASVNGKIK